MELRKAIIEILERAETELRDLISTESKAGRYDEVSVLLLAAGGLKSLSHSISKVTKDGSVTAPLGSTVESVSPSLDLKVEQERQRARGAISYPSFFREGGRLVKVSWSRSTNSEYEHKAGKAVLDAVVSAILRVSERKNRFTVEALGRITLDDGAHLIPAYQVYLCLAWLRHERLIEPLGRDGYAFPEKSKLELAVTKRWAQLKERAR